MQSLKTKHNENQLGFFILKKMKYMLVIQQGEEKLKQISKRM